MSARFRIRTPTGQELSFASLDVFREFVRSGDLSPDDVVYDAETREWSSARTHPVVLEIEMGDAEAQPVEPVLTPAPPVEPELTPVEETPPPFGMDDAGGMGDIGLELAPAPNQLSPEQEAAAFMAKLEAERAADLGPDEEVPIQSFTMESPGADAAEPMPTAAAQPAEPLPVPRSFRQERPSPAPSRPARAPVEEKPSVAWRYAPFAILVLVVGGLGVYFGPDFFGSSTSGIEDAAADPVPQPTGPAPVIAATDDALRGRARERFLTSSQTLLRGLEPIPQAWLSGRYLATPSDYAYVRDVWQTYLSTVREVRAGDGDRYRTAYLRALEDAGVQEPTRTARLERGVSEFELGAAARNRHYDRVQTLATVAISGHDALVGAEGRILYEPATGPRVSNDPVIEAVGRTPADQALLEEILDAILAEVQGPGGPGTAANVREWVYDGLLDAVTN
ncbi:MAG: hypothetical protein AB7T31_00700 [Gemmatimonadales bacterium]